MAVSDSDRPISYDHGYTFEQTQALRRAVDAEYERQGGDPSDGGPPMEKRLTLLANYLESVPWHRVPGVSCASAACFAQMCRAAAQEVETDE